MRILIATDAWSPQVNGVVRTLRTTVAELERLGHAVRVVEPGLFPNIACPIYPEIRLAFPWTTRIDALLHRFQPERVHIATEGPIGLQVRRACIRHRLAFSTSYHTKFPEYLRTHLGIPPGLSYRFMRWFHGSSSSVMVATPSLEEDLRRRGFRCRFARWSRGVDMSLFHPRPRTYPPSHRPILMYVGRLSREKNLDDFFRIRTTGTKYLVGDGPLRRMLQRKHGDAVFLGSLIGESLGEAYANADVVVFPSKTDTFGLVILEALASGVPVAAYPVTGPRDILEPPLTGSVAEDLQAAVEKALRHGEPEACIGLARRYSWEETARQFVGNLVPTRQSKDCTLAVM